MRADKLKFHIFPQNRKRHIKFYFPFKKDNRVQPRSQSASVSLSSPLLLPQLLFPISHGLEQIENEMPFGIASFTIDERAPKFEYQ
jgi:hypothetical protein